MDINEKIEKYLVEEKMEESEDCVGTMGLTNRSTYTHRFGNTHKRRTIQCPHCRNNFDLED